MQCFLIFFFNTVALKKKKAYYDLVCPWLENTVLYEAPHTKFFVPVSFSLGPPSPATASVNTVNYIV